MSRRPERDIAATLRGKALGILGTATLVGARCSGSLGFSAVLFVLGGLDGIVQPLVSVILGRVRGSSRLGRRHPIPALRTTPLLIPVLIALVGCAGITTASGSTPVVGTPVAVTAGGNQVMSVQALDSMQFAPNTIVVRAGQPVQLTLKNAGQMTHDLTINDGVAKPVKVVAQPGQSATSTFTIERPGTYTFSCSQPMHQIRGMQGTITAR